MSPMETQAHMDIQQERSKKPMEEITEEKFLKDLYMFMKTRETPIERIPNLGFKQIDLFVMFKVVRDLGGYHQVTAQQLWKQVYNTLGGNPRSTSAATCTRRHYEKLLLPYECHVTGILVNVLPRNQPKHFHYSNYSKEHDDGQRPPKRKLLSIPLLQNPHNLQADLHDFPLPPHYPHYYHTNHAVLPPHVPISSPVLTPLSPPAPKAWFPFPPSHLTPMDRVKEPLEQLRFLAEQYKTTSRLAEPLNLSVKAPRQETTSNPASSFTPPSSTKNPKFLNKPFPLYTPHHPQVARSNGGETPDGEAGSGDASYSYTAKSREAYVINVEDETPRSPPTYDAAWPPRTDEGPAATPPKPSSPKADSTNPPKEDTRGSLEARELNFSHILPGIPRENGGKMEIEVPLSVFHNWLRLCGTTMHHRGRQLPSLPPQEERRNRSDVVPTNLAFHVNPRRQSPAPEDLRVTQKNSTSPPQTNGNHHNGSQSHFHTYKPLPSGGILKGSASRDVFPFDVNKPYISKPPNCWDGYNKDTRSSPLPLKLDSSPRAARQDFATSASIGEGTSRGGKESDPGPSAVLMLNSSSTSLLRLTTEEVMKLKKMISSST